MTRPKRVVYQVQCAYNPKHIFDKEFEIVEGSENLETEIDAYCPFCDKYVTVGIKGEPPLDKLLRKFDVD